jgi:hypothetical protein
MPEFCGYSPISVSTSVLDSDLLNRPSQFHLFDIRFSFNEPPIKAGPAYFRQ